MKKKHIAAIIEARSNSTRLPGKILLKASGKTILEYLVIRLKLIKKIDSIIIATTKNKDDDKIVELANKLKIKSFRGDEYNVLKRVNHAAKHFKVDTIVRITSDCPLNDLNIIAQFIDIFNNNNFDIVTNAHLRSFPIGMDVEIIKSIALNKSYKLAITDHLKEHICLTIYKHKNKFNICNIIAPPNLHYPNLGLTLDEYGDYVLIKKIIGYMSKNKKLNYTCEELIKLIFNKKWIDINKIVKRTKHKYQKYINKY